MYIMRMINPGARLDAGGHLPICDHPTLPPRASSQSVKQRKQARICRTSRMITPRCVLTGLKPSLVPTTPLHTITPLLHAPALSHMLNCNVWLKMENEQPSGSFKMRGVGTACSHAVHQHNATTLVAASGGNAGMAVAVAGEQLGVSTRVFVPSTTSQLAQGNMRAHGAHIVQVGSTGTCLDDAIAAAQAYVDDHPNAVFIPPFDHPDVFDGNGTIIDEILAQLGVGGVGSKLGIVCSVGGGGLFAGMVERLHENGLTNVPIVAVETEGAASLNHAIQAQQLVTLDVITSVATTLGAKRVAWRALHAAQRNPTFPMTVTDRQAVEACVLFLEEMGVVVEPACGTALAPLYLKHEALRAVLGDVLTPDFNLVVVVCGGTTTSEGMLRILLNELV